MSSGIGAYYGEIRYTLNYLAESASVVQGIVTTASITAGVTSGSVMWST